MSDRTLVVYDDVFASYDFGRSHPMRPVRLALTMELSPAARRPGPPRRDGPGAAVARPTTCSSSSTTRCTSRASSAPPTTCSAGCRCAGASAPATSPSSRPCTRRARSSPARACRPPGPSGRAPPSTPSTSPAGCTTRCAPGPAASASTTTPPSPSPGCCRAGAERVAYVDVDVHHGDGVEAAFYDDPRVLTISLHESGRTLFPGTGWADQVGGDAALGHNVNVALPAGTGDAGWLRAFTAVVPPALRAFRPQVLLTQHGCDTHALDPLAHLLCSVDGQRTTYRLLHELAHELCGGKWVVTGGGGYEPVQVVPRAWTHLLAEVAGGGAGRRRHPGRLARRGRREGRRARPDVAHRRHPRHLDALGGRQRRPRRRRRPRGRRDPAARLPAPRARPGARRWLTPLLRSTCSTPGSPATSPPARAENLRNFDRMAQGRTTYDFGLVPARRYDRDDVLEVMARLCGVHPDPALRGRPGHDRRRPRRSPRSTGCATGWPSRRSGASGCCWPPATPPASS